METVFTRLSLKCAQTLRQALIQPGLEQVLGQFNADEDHFADFGLACSPFGAQVAAHELVHTLEDDLAVHARNVQHTLVAQHARAVDLHHRAQEVFQLGGVEGLVGLVDEGLHVVVMRMVMRVVAGFAVSVVMGMVVLVTMAVSVVAVGIVLEKIGVDVELGVEVEALEVKDLGNGHLAKMHALLRRAGVHVLDAVGEGVGLRLGHQVGLADEDLVGKAHLAARFLALVQLLLAVLGVHQGQDGVEQVQLGNLVVHEEGLGDRTRIGHAGGLEDDTFEVQGAVLALLGQVGQRFAQVFTDGAAHTAVVHLNNVFLGVGHENLVVDVFFTEFVLDHGDALAVGFGEDTFEQRGLAAAEETGKDGDGYQAHERSVVLTPQIQGQECGRVRRNSADHGVFLQHINHDTLPVSDSPPSRPPRGDRPHGSAHRRKDDHRSLFVRLVEFISPGPDTTAELIETLADAEHRELIEPESRVMLEGVIRMAGMTVADVMVPVRRMDMLDIDAPYETLLAQVIEDGHSRFPVYEGERDNIIGVLMSKDLLKLQRSPGLNLRTLLRPAVFVPESKGLNELLREFRSNRSHLAMAIDEFGMTSGLVTIEDVLEEIVGEIEDEFDEEDRQSSIFTLADGSQRVAGDALIDAVNEVFQTQLPDDEFETIGGLVAHELGRVPRRGESVDVGGLRFVVMLARGGAVRWFKVTRAPDMAPVAEAG